MPDFKLKLFSDLDPQTQDSYFRFLKGDQLADTAESLATYLHDHCRECTHCGTDYAPDSVDEEDGLCCVCQAESYEQDGLGLYGNSDVTGIPVWLETGWMGRL